MGSSISSSGNSTCMSISQSMKSSKKPYDPDIKDALSEHKDLGDKVKNIEKKIDSLKDVPMMLVKAEALKETLLEEMKSLEESATCKCCLQVLPPDQKQKHTQEYRRKAKECFESLKIGRKKSNELDELKKEHKILSVELSAKIDDIKGFNYRIGNAESNIKQLQKDKKDKEAANNLTALLNSLS